MRLINTTTLGLQEFSGAGIPKYAILSHRWEEEEVTYTQWMEGSAMMRNKKGYKKIRGACKEALKDGFSWLWVDTNCIDKSSSAELTEAINSMFRWYTDAEICYAYLSDVSATGNTFRIQDFRRSQWFTRGWTLQELLAPKQLTFYSQEWSHIGGLSDPHLLASVSEITSIETSYLAGYMQINMASAAKRMSWLSKRTTTKEEDMAYCMLGIFEVNMPLLYGEGSRAFIRLQEEIIKSSSDHSLFCWSYNSSVPRTWVSLLAPTPRAFEKSSNYVAKNLKAVLTPYMMTNLGLSIQLPIIHTLTYAFVVLNAGLSQQSMDERACIAVRYDQTSTSSIRSTLALSRYPFPHEPMNIHRHHVALMRLHQVFVNTKPGVDPWRSIVHSTPERYGVLLLMEPTHPRLFDNSKPIGFRHPINSGREVPYILPATIATYPPDQFMFEKSVLNLKYRPRESSRLAASLLEIRHRSEPESGYILLFGIRNDSSGMVKWYSQLVARSTLVAHGRLGEKFQSILKNFIDSYDSEPGQMQSTAQLPDGSLILKMGPYVEADPSQRLRIFYLLGPEQVTLVMDDIDEGTSDVDSVSGNAG
ncbi:Vegetative incompatibility protein [Paramyrothecium foliicola]|nr:Vegetative incompatibility protein [Paramyrothecium foliicola]